MMQIVMGRMRMAATSMLTMMRSNLVMALLVRDEVVAGVQVTLLDELFDPALN
jgi:hypothetical protein